MSVKWVSGKYIESCTCDTCGHKWVPKRPMELPLQCPSCKVPQRYWNRKEGAKK